MYHRACRLALLAYDLFAIAAVVAIASLGFPHVAWAYVDPSVLTYTIQAVAGVAVALSAVAGVAFRRTRRVLMTRMGIDENANKVKEQAVHRIDVEDGPSAMHSAPALVDGRAEGEGSSAPKSAAARWRSAAFASCFLAFTLLVVAPIEMVAGSAGSLVVGVGQVWPIVVVTALVVAAVLTVILAVLPERIAEPLRIVVICLGACCWVQALFLNRNLPSADGEMLDWGRYAKHIAISSVVWLVMLIGPLVARWKLAPSRMVSTGATLVACALFVVQGVGLASLFMPGSDNQELQSEYHSHVLTERGMFTVSDQNNVIVFILDNYDTEHLKQAVSDEPTLLDRFTGFTWYQNSTAAMIPTRYGVPFLLTGQYPREGEKFSTFLSERYERSDYLDRIAATGATMGIYSDTLGLQYVSDAQAADILYDKTVNFTDANDMPIDSLGAAGMLARCALYRDMPWALKPLFWFYTDEVNNAIVDLDEESNLDLMPYMMSDGRWYRQLGEHGLSLDENAAAPAFRFIHLLGSHKPYTIDENGVDIGTGNSTRELQARGSMRMVGDYLDQLKALGVYDRTTVIITADHGNYYHISTPLKTPATPIMLVKPAGASDEPLAVSDAAVAAQDVMPTVLEALGADSQGYGEPMWSLSDPDRPRRYLMTTSDGSHDQEILEYEIKGDALDLDNWKLTGLKWAAQE